MTPAPSSSAAAPSPVSDNVVIFVDDDDAYRKWLYANPSGFVVNTGRNVTPGYLQLHRATCETITPTPDRAWTRDYIKVCSLGLYELEAWARSHGGRLSSGCDSCNP